MWRRIAGVVVGLLAGGTAMSLMEMLSHALYPLPKDLDLQNLAAWKEAIGQQPAGAFALVLLSWAVGSFVGGSLAVGVDGKLDCWSGIAVGVIFTAGGIMNLTQLPHPPWFGVIGLPLFIPMAYLGARVIARGRAQGLDAPTGGGPTPG